MYWQLPASCNKEPMKLETTALIGSHISSKRDKETLLDSFTLVNMSKIQSLHNFISNCAIEHVFAFRSQMIGDDDYRFITEYLSSDSAKRAVLLESQRVQCAKTFLSLLEHISKDQTVQYILTIMDDMFQVNQLQSCSRACSLTATHLTGGQKPRRNHRRIREEEARKRLVAVLKLAEQARRFHTEHDVSHHCQTCLLVARSHGRLGSHFLLDLAQRPDANPG